MNDQCRARILWMQQNLLPYEPEIRSWLRRNRVNEAEVDDIVQEMYARIGTVSDLQAINSPRMYAYQVAKAIRLNMLRRRHVISITADGDLEKLTVPCNDASPEEEIAQRDELTRVVNVIAGLPERTRDVLLLRRVAGLSQRETARRLAISEKTVERHLAQAAMVLMNQFGRGSRVRDRTMPEMEPTDGCDKVNGRSN